MRIPFSALVVCLVSIEAVAADVPLDITFTERAVLDTNTLPVAARERLAQLKVGMTRKQLSTLFGADGGLICPMAERHYLLDVWLTNPNHVVMIDVALRPAGMNDATLADPAKRMEWFRTHEWFPGSPNDVVVACGHPYESGIAID